MFVSSLAARGPKRADRDAPVNAYGRSKLEAERLLQWRSDEVSTVIVRAPAVYGPRDRDVLTLFRMALRGVFTMVHGGHQRLSLIHAADLAEGIRLACERDTASETLSFTDGHDLELIDFGRAIARAVDAKVRLVSLPDAAMWVAAAGGEAWGRLRPGTRRPSTSRASCTSSATTGRRTARPRRPRSASRRASISTTVSSTP